MTSSSLKILHGPANIAGMPALLAKAQRDLGFDAVSICLPDNGFQFRPDFILGGGSPAAPKKKVRDFWLKDFWRFDIYHFYFDTSYLGQSLADVNFLLSIGKRVFFTFLGCDVRDRVANLKKSLSVCHECAPIGCSANRAQLIALSRKVEATFVTTPDLLDVLPHATYLPLPIDLTAIESAITLVEKPDSDRFRVLHAPTDTGKKGTRFIVDAVERLRDEGVAIDLLMPDRLPQQELHALARTCDAAIDQLMAGVFGTFAAEMMALGLPVIARLDKAYIESYGPNLPIIHADPQSITDVIRNMAKRTDLAEVGRASKIWSSAAHGSLQVAQMLDEAYHRTERQK